MKNRYFFTRFIPLIKYSVGASLLSEVAQNIRANYYLYNEKNKNKFIGSYESIRQDKIKSDALKAFSDIGFKGSVDVIFNDAKDFEAECVTYRKGLNRAALVIVGLDDDTLKYYNSSSMYAIMGHEAAHAYRNHSTIVGFTLGALCSVLLETQGKLSSFSMLGRFRLTSPVLTLVKVITIYLASRAISRQVEMDADKFSCRKLNTTHVLLLEYMRHTTSVSKATDKKNVSLINQSREVFQALNRTHPSCETRIRHLEQLREDMHMESMGFFRKNKDKSVSENDFYNNYFVV
ncbi:MAG: M48 family metalloprotease [Legionella sp.]|nr:M48 family metalloprotease [Legionella sp.]